MYGDEIAFSVVPRTFKLPEEMDEWAGMWWVAIAESGAWMCSIASSPPPDWIKSHPCGSEGGDGASDSLWMLKNNKQRGTGLRLIRASEAFDAVFETTTRPGMEGMVLYRWAGRGWGAGSVEEPGGLSDLFTLPGGTWRSSTYRIRCCSADPDL